MLILLTIAGGVALILFGVRFLRKGLDRLLGPRLGHVIQRLTRTRFHAFFAGLTVALAAPSSTTVSILAVQSVKEGHLTARKMLAVMLGANIGLTIMVLLISLQPDRYAAILIFVGVVLFQFTKRRGLRGVGQIVLSLGLIFTALGIIKGAAGAFEPGGDFVTLLRIAQDQPVWVAVIGAVLTMLMQSSTAAIALVIGLGAAGTVELPLGLAVVFGANVGLGLTMLMIGWNQVESRRLALANLLAKIVIAAAGVALLPVAAEWIGKIPVDLDKRIAFSHTGFNLVTAAVFLPLVTPLHALAKSIVPESPRAQARAFGPRYITDQPAEGLSLAVGQSLREVLRVSEIVRAMLNDLWRALEQRDVALARQVQDRDDQVDLLDREIKQYLAAVADREDEPDQAGQIIGQLRYLNELETIGDVIDKNLCELAIKRAKHQIAFSPQDWEDVSGFYHKVAENLLIAETAFATRDQVLAEKLLRHKDRLSEVERDLRDRHLGRLKPSLPRDYEASAVHLDLLTHFKRINTCATHAAYAVLQNQEQAA